MSQSLWVLVALIEARAAPSRSPFRRSQKGGGVAVVGREGQNRLCSQTNRFPIEPGNSFVRFIKQEVDSTLDTLTGHDGGIVASVRSFCPQRQARVANLTRSQAYHEIASLLEPVNQAAGLK